MGNLPSKCGPLKIAPTPHIVFLSRKEAEVALEEADQLDSFQDRIDEYPINRRARRHLSYTPVDGPSLPVDISGLTFDIRICWLHTTAEGGMPHTRPPDLVCLPLYWKEDDLSQILTHEIVHIDQRRRSAHWIQWCIQNSWSLVKSSAIPDRWVAQCRLNPDTMAYPFWAYQNRWVPLPLFERNDTPDLRKIRVKWWDMRTGDLLLREPAELREIVKGVANPEHPFEIAAYKNVHLDPLPVKKILDSK